MLLVPFFIITKYIKYIVKYIVKCIVKCMLNGLNPEASVVCLRQTYVGPNFYLVSSMKSLSKYILGLELHKISASYSL